MARSLLAMAALMLGFLGSERALSAPAAIAPQGIWREVVDVFVEACVNRYGDRAGAGRFILEKFGVRVRSLSESDIAELLGFNGGVGWMISLPQLETPVLIEENFLNACSAHVIDADADAIRAEFRNALGGLAKCCHATFELREEKILNYKDSPARFTHYRLQRPSSGTLQLTINAAHAPGEPGHLIMTAIKPRN